VSRLLNKVSESPPIIKEKPRSKEQNTGTHSRPLTEGSKDTDRNSTTGRLTNPLSPTSHKAEENQGPKDWS
jgi:hypothetical protein